MMVNAELYEAVEALADVYRDYFPHILVEQADDGAAVVIAPDSLAFHYRRTAENPHLWDHNELDEDGTPFLSSDAFDALEEIAEDRYGAVLGDSSADYAYVDLDRKSTRLNSSHVKISYAVFCLKKK